MKTEIVPSTAEVVSLRYLEIGADNSRVMWAENMITSGFESDHLYILVGEAAPFHKFEMDGLFDKVIKELGIPEIVSRVEAINTYATCQIMHFLNGQENSGNTLLSLANIYNNFDQLSGLFEFYSLNYAFIDLANGEEQYYWPEATSENIEAIILKECQKWSDTHPLEKWENYDWKLH